jgi:quaternary ammonium compound-resistance protein SugE
VAWLLLVLAGSFEVGFVTGLKLSEGFTRLWPSVLAFASGGVSFWLLSVAMREIPAGTAYAVWTGIGAAGAVLIGVLFFEEPASALRFVGVALILGGVATLRLTEGS